MPRWIPLDWVLVVDTVLTGTLIVVCAASIPEWPWLIPVHVGILALLLWLPPRGASWELAPPGTPFFRKHLRGAVRYTRYNFPILLVIFFFEEVRYTVNAIRPDEPYWFEPYLYEADRWLFGELPAVSFASWVSLPLTEIMYAFYFAYFLIIASGFILAWVGTNGGRRVMPGPGFEPAITSTVTAFLLASIWYPWLPSRGPWENEALMAGLPVFEGIVFTPLTQWILGYGSVSGGCFPSSHVAGTWGLVLGIREYHPRAARILGALAIGMSFSCVFLRYHHAVDVLVGFPLGVLGAALGRRWAGERHGV
jgi:membrane-associated phospholipid phosphatase